MNAFVAHFQELLNQGYIQVLLGIYVATQLWWWLKVIIASRNRTYDAPYKGTYAIFMGIYRPDPAALRRTLKSIATHTKPTELIIVVDDAPHAPKRLLALANKYATKVIALPQRLGAREQYAAAAEALKKRPDIIITASPDAEWDESTLRVLQPFSDERVGAVTACEATTETRTFAGKLSQWYAATRFAVEVPLQSYFGVVKPVSARLLAARREVFTTSVLAARHETFLGRRILTAAAESFAAHILAQGYRSTCQPTAAVHVTPTSTLKALFQERLQRARESLRSLFRHARVLVKANPIGTLATLFAALSPVVYGALGAGVAFIVAYNMYAFGTGLTLADAAWFAAVAVVVYLSLAYLRYAPLGCNYALSPLFAAVGGLVQFAAKTAALFTFAENDRAARSFHAYGEGKVGRARVATAATGVALFAIGLPLAYFALIHPQQVPVNVVTAGQGRSYADARDFSQRLTDTDTKNDPTSDELLQLIRTNGSHYNQQVNEDLARESYGCVRMALKNFTPDTTLDNVQACYAHVVTMADATKNVAAVPVAKSAPTVPATVVVTAAQGDTFTYLVRAQTKKLDVKNELSATQAVYIETTYLHQTGQLERYLGINEHVTVNTDHINTLIASAKTLTAEQIAAWAHYGATILW